MNNVINEINQRLENILSQYPDSKVKEAMYYSLKAGGKNFFDTGCTQPHLFQND